ncbi:MAG: hypothetical protein G01um10148_432 [Parcubacteria group bacterium Gr01-1014_8]|nr:MAG: hypothetical protein G01um10148_432 [Parcubacteria group bacterium Gr01-1014_8]
MRAGSAASRRIVATFLSLVLLPLLLDFAKGEKTFNNGDKNDEADDHRKPVVHQESPHGDSSYLSSPVYPQSVFAGEHDSG